MTQEIINVGAVPNDGEGDPLRTAFQKINNNFTQLYSTGYFTSSAYSVGLGTNQVIFEAPVETFTQGIFQINSNDTDSLDTENIMLNVSLINDGNSLIWNGHNTLFNGNVLTGYDMDIVDANVRILVNPLANTTIFHFISAQITWTGIPVVGLIIETENAILPESLITENDAFALSTQNQNTV
jgi:hypothetical protein